MSDIQTQILQLTIKTEKIQESLGRIESRQISELRSQHLQDYEFQVYSQWGEDGIIQYLIKSINIEKKIFVELGAENYTECNTRFLLVNNNWSGLVIDGIESCVAEIKRSKSYWMYNLKAARAFITKDNINQLLTENGLRGDIGLLSIDLDGNDYWIWEAIKSINPVIVIVEYNHRFGKQDAVTIPYDSSFVRSHAHYSSIYYGASLKALHILGQKKGYELIGCSSNGVNAFFVRKDKMPSSIKPASPEEAYRIGQFCDCKDLAGNIVKMTPNEEIDFVRNEVKLPLVKIDEED